MTDTGAPTDAATGALPIDAVMPQLLDAFASRGAVVLSASTGAGKTTRVPWALAQHPCTRDGQVLVLEPRRLAARLAAERVAAEQGLKVGGAVGYAVRFARKASEDTRLLFMTEALLTRRLQRDPELRDVAAVVFDELHERHLHSDLGLALVAALRAGQRTDLRWLAMSATLDGDAVAERYGAAALSCPGRQHPVEIEHLAKPSREPLDRQVATAVRQLLRAGVRGHVLVFLPSLAEIRRAETRCQALARDHDIDLHLLHGRLPRAQQDRAVAPSRRQKVILATNVAESAITIAGVEAVIDSGLANVAVQHAYASMGRLASQPISQASATQRAGRAGRTGPGRCIRLYTVQDHHRRPAFDTPAIERSDLCELLLTLRLAGHDASDLHWLTPPPEPALRAAEQLLIRLNALDANGRPKADARQLCSLPVHPRHARALLEAARLGITPQAAEALALVAEQADLHRTRPGDHRRDSSLWQQLELLDELGGDMRSAHRAPPHINGPAAARTLRAAKQLQRLADSLPQRVNEPPTDPTHALMIAMARGFVDRVARRVGRGAPKPGAPLELALIDGGRATMHELSSLGPEGFTLVLAAHERPNRPALVHLAMPLSADALLDAFADDMRDETQFVFDLDRERVMHISRLMLGKLIIDESRRSAEPSEESATVLRAALDKREFAGAIDRDAWASLSVRLARALSEPPPEARLNTTLDRLCREHTSFAELRQRDVLATLLSSLDPEQRKQLQRRAPQRVTLASGRSLPVQYPAGAPPYLEGYLQDFFGMPEGPKLAGDPLVLRLWAPNRRPLQVTDDLASFWRNHYPTLRRQLSRRYPKHHFPDDPAHAKAALLKRHL